MLAVAATVSVLSGAAFFNNILAEHSNLRVQHNIIEATHTTNMKTMAIMDSDLEHSGILFRNTGLSSLTIKSVHLYDKESNLVESTAYEINNHFGLGGRFKINPLHPKDAIQNGEEHWLLQSYMNTKDESVLVRDFLESASIDICYCSMTNKCESKTLGIKQHPKNQC